jgi:hypothetical protein
MIDFNKLSDADQKIYLKSKIADGEKDLHFLRVLDRVLKTEDGKEVVTYIIKYCDPFGESFVNSGLSAFNSGKQDVGKHLMAQAIRSGNELKATECIDNSEADRLSNAISYVTDEIQKIRQQLKQLQQGDNNE